MREKSGSITSPDYPAHYPNNANCQYIIKQPEGLRIILAFELFDLEEEIECQYDVLEVRIVISLLLVTFHN